MIPLWRGPLVLTNLYFKDDTDSDWLVISCGSLPLMQYPPSHNASKD